MGLPKEIVILDLEWTSWEGSLERWWTGPGEHREVVQIGAVVVETDRDFTELSSFQVLIKPLLNPNLSDHFIHLTRITQDKIEVEGITFPEAFQQFQEWSSGLKLYSWTETDFEVLAENCKIWSTTMTLEHSRFLDIRSVFWKKGIPAEKFHSGNVIEAFNKKPPRETHDALNDVKNLVDALKELIKLPLTNF